MNFLSPYRQTGCVVFACFVTFLCVDLVHKTAYLFNMDAREGQLTTVREVAARFKVNTKQVTQWIRDGKLRAIDVSRTGARVPRYRFTDEAIQEFIATLEGEKK